MYEELRKVQKLVAEAEVALIKAERLLRPIPRIPPVMSADRHLSDCMRELARSKAELHNATNKKKEVS